MNEQKKNSAEDACCSEGGCGKGCRCAGLGIGALVLLLIGGIIGYLIAGSCRASKLCPPGTPCPYSQTSPAPAK